ncbi:MAG: alpha/beta hydrolase [Hyphomicrobium sp.]
MLETLLRTFAALCVLLILASATARPATAQESTSPSTVAARQAELRRELAAKLGLPVEQLGNNVDLVKDLKFDRATVDNAVRALLAEQNARKVRETPTRVGDILAAAAIKSPASLGVERSFAGPTSAVAYSQSVFYATDRKPSGSAAIEASFGAERAPGGVMRFGRVEVNIPKSHKAGQIERPYTSLFQSNDPASHIFMRTLKPLTQAELFAAIAPGATPDDVLLYIHGFNNNFEDAILRTGQMAFDFGFKGAPIAFTWPSYRSVLGYGGDSENMAWSVKHIADFLTKLASDKPGRKLHVVAHSMGSRGLLGALRMLALQGRRTTMLKTVILCAPDFDAGLFSEQVAAEVKPLAEQWVVYASKQDYALALSEKVNATLRLGTPLTFAQGYQIVDASEVEVTPWSLPEIHTYFAVKERLIRDLRGVLEGLPPAARGLTSKVSGRDTFWELR